MKKLLLSLTVCMMAVSAGAQDEPPLSQLPVLENSHPKANEMAELGRLLFFDTRLSGDGSTSCAECHSPDAGFGDGADLARGYPSTRSWRNSQTIVNSAYLEGGLHWDGSVPSLLHQVPGAMGGSIVSNIDQTMAEERLRQIPEYAALFDEIWGEPATVETIAAAIAAYEATLVSRDSPFDQFIGGQGSMSEEAGRGYFLFVGKANCIACHNGPLATDQDFHNTSVPPNPSFLSDPLVQISYRVAMRGFGVDPEVYNELDRDPGLYAVTGNPDDMGKMRTPPLRYLSYTAPYMHNGMFYTLEEVVDFYSNGGTADTFGTKSDRIKPLNLTAQEKSDLVAFLESMSGEEIRDEFPDLPDYKTDDRAFEEASAPEIIQPPAQSNKTNAGLESASPGLVIVPSGS